MNLAGAFPLCYGFSMVTFIQSMPRPRELAQELSTPFVLVIGWFAALLSAVYLVAGKNPAAPVAHFLHESVEALLPLVAFLVAVWLVYLIVYLLLNAYLFSLWTNTSNPNAFSEFARHSFYSPPSGPTHPFSVFPLLYLVRLNRPDLRMRLATGWRAGDSAQLE